MHAISKKIEIIFFKLNFLYIHDITRNFKNSFYVLKFDNIYIESCAGLYWIKNKKNFLNSIKNTNSMLKNRDEFF